MRVDPLAEKFANVGSYVYCLNNPVKLVDPDGKEPGDFFLAKDAAALDFGNMYNDNSIRSGQEYGSRFYMIKNSEGNVGYTYTVPNIWESGNSVSLPNVPAGAVSAGDTHTHGSYSFGKWADNLFSGSWDKNKMMNTPGENKAVNNTKTDIGVSNAEGQTMYVSTPNGSMQKYDPSTGKISTISTQMPSDKNDPGRLNKNDANVEKNPVDIAKPVELYKPLPSQVPFIIN